MPEWCENLQQKIEPMLWIIFILGAILGLLLFLPIRLEIDTVKDVYRLHWQGIMSFWLDAENAEIKGFMKLFFWTIPIRRESKSKIIKTEPEKKRSATKRKPPLNINRGIALFRNLSRAVRVKKFELDWDTGDFPLNAHLFPVFRQLSSGKRRLSTNFYGNQTLILQLQTRIGALILGFLQVFVHLKIK